MANRSDFYSAKLPRSLKKLLSLGEASGARDKAAASAARKIFLAAHASHVGFKLRRSSESNRDAADGE